MKATFPEIMQADIGFDLSFGEKNKKPEKIWLLLSY
jgi:hypothetical protein